MGKSHSPTVWVLAAEYAPAMVGGLGTVATHLTESLKKSKVRVKVIAGWKSKHVRSTRRNDVKVVRIPDSSRYFHAGKKSYRGKSIERAARKHDLHEPDVIHVHSLEFAEAALRLKRKYRAPIVYTCHSLTSGSSSRKSQQDALFRHASAIVVPSRWLQRCIRRKYSSRIASKTLVIPNGVKPVSKKAKGPPYRLLFVGRMVEEKGIEPLIRSISILARRNKRVRLTVIGKSSPNYLRRLRTIARRTGIHSRVRWLGFQQHGRVQRLYASHGSVVVPSKEESFCLVALEAMANGVPLVSTRAGGLREFVNGRNAQIIASVQPESIARAVQAMWAHPERTRKRVIRALRTARSFNWRRMAAQYKRLFRKLD